MRVRDSIHSDRYPDSYYVASAGKLEPFLRLEGSSRFDVCVIGAGFTGLNAAIELRQRGYTVAVLEQNRVGWGASGRNGGQLLGGFGLSFPTEQRLGAAFDDNVRQKMFLWGQECVDIALDRIKSFKIDCDLRMGFYDAAMTSRQLDEVKAYRDAMVAAGYPHPLEIEEGEDAKSVVRTDAYVGGMVNRAWGHLHPLKLCHGLAQAAADLGVKIYEDARVSDIIEGQRSDGRVIVDTDTAKVVADYVIVAANAYQGPLMPKVAKKSVPVGSYIMATERLGARAERYFPQNVAVSDQRMVLDYYRLSADGRLLFGGLATYSGNHPRDIRAKLLPGLERVFPRLKDMRIDYRWGGYLCVGANRIPQFGRAGKNIFYGHGYAGHGLAPSHLGGRLLAEVVAGTAERFDVMAAIKHRDLPGGMMRQPLFALGMLGVKLKDKLGL